MPLRPRGDDPPGSPRARGTPAPHTPRREDSPPPRPRLVRWLIPRTLSGRLIAGLVALLAIACASVGAVTYLTVQRTLSQDLTNQLQTATSLANNCMDSTLGRGPGDDGDSDDQAGQAPQGGDDTSHGPSACGELGPGTFWAYTRNGQWGANLVPSTITLSAKEKRALLAITPYPIHQNPGTVVPTHTLDLPSAGGEFELTVVKDLNGATYFTGLTLRGMHDFLKDVALAEAAVFGGVLLFAGVLGTLWVRLSLRPLRRVAATASRVAELPLETGEVALPKGVPDTDPQTETGQVGLAFNRMLGHVEAALQRRAASEARLRRFAADASHELRTPLAAIRGYAELGLLHPGESPERVTHALGRVLSESTRMSVLVDDLLLLARLDAGRPLSREPVDMTRLAIDATSDAQVARPTHRWVLELPDDPVTVSGDEHRLHQVLTNLLSNAGRHTPEGTTVTVTVSGELPPGEPGTGPESVRHGTIPSGPLVVATVTDNGPGIPPDMLPDLFERFTRADTSRSHVADANSTGLGLAIVDAVVAAHNGAVLVTSHPGMTRFTIALSQLTEPAAPPPRTRPARKALHNS
jgi:two-component system, OmpR family, sensor kinase